MIDRILLATQQVWAVMEDEDRQQRWRLPVIAWVVVGNLPTDIELVGIVPQGDSTTLVHAIDDFIGYEV
jgi:hypothetical protein